MSKQSLFCLFLLLVLLLSACGPTPATTPASSGSSVTVTPRPTATATPRPFNPIRVEPQELNGTSVVVWHALFGPAAELFGEQVRRFNSENEWGISILPTALGDYPTLYAAMQNALQSGATPDLVITLPEQALAWDAAGAVVDLEPYVHDARYGFTSADIADIPAVFWNQDMLDGRRLGIPAQRSARFLFYNATWAYELGFEEPPRDAEAFSQRTCAANASFRADSDMLNDGLGGWVVDAHWQTVYPWLQAFGGGVLGEGGYRFRQDPNLEALQFLKSLYDDHCAWLSSAPTAYEAFARRSALVISGDLSEVPLVSNAMSLQGNHDTWTLLPFPGPQGRVVIAYGPSFTLIESSEREQLAAWLFVRWMLSPAHQAEWVEATGLLPLRASSLSLLNTYRREHPQWSAAVDLLPQMTGVPQLASWRTVRYALEDGTFSIFRLNIAVEDIPAVLTEMDATAEELTGGE
jgi:ABC-type glycerol-3-phosphate transport system substrate-binding protein